MAIQRVFLDWKRPALAAAAEHLLAAFSRPPDFDLGRVIVVVPGARAGRRLLEILVALAEQRQLALTPPDFVSQHELPERLYVPRRQFADVLTQRLAWTQALRSFTPERLVPYLPFPPAADDTPRWLAVADTLRGLHLELAADAIDCRDVLRRAAVVEGFAEEARWQTLCELQREY